MCLLLVTEYTKETGGGYGFYQLYPCCQTFEKAWNENAIGFGERRDGFNCLAFETGFNIFQIDVGWECDVDRVDWPIAFCPFCGKSLIWKVARRGPNDVRRSDEIETWMEPHSYL
ncbi:hypothetical protein M0R72_21160 [Candidatus Pacearchaeota archaeon]|jgi:hypothetical protein|nr:hypothetical protein [Candidatus Pacearchaeota archaeon]